VIALPPLLAGAVKLTVACALPALAATAVGAPGTVAGVTAVDELLAAPLPMALVATTLKVYAVPLTRPVTLIGEAAPLALIPPGLDVTV
jgi:hypothetical protein